MAQEFVQNGKTFYSFVLPHHLMKQVSFTSVFTESNRDGDQRPLNLKHVKQFADAIENKQAVRPQSLVGSLTSKVKIQPTDKQGIVYIIFPSSKKDGLRLNDGQHAVEAVSQSNGQEHSWNHLVVAGYNLSDAECQMSHSGTNYYQMKSIKAINAYIEYLNRRLPHDKQKGGEIFDRLNKDPESILYRRVRCYHMQKPEAGELLGFADFVDRFVYFWSSPSIAHMTDENIYELLRSYYMSWRTHFARIWDDTDAYILNKKMGLKVMTCVAGSIFLRAEIFRKKITSQTIDDVIKELSKRIDKGCLMAKAGKWNYQAEKDRVDHILTKLRFRAK
ncbi:hypothetical protein LCGC14_1920160 [marine sediment metagenome]|uniref:DGQHR domain-containing protein n=1 Tax=marine sediment metagenome TaxID=412755 RepID=A0A0F9INT5_9ZZZZ